MMNRISPTALAAIAPLFVGCAEVPSVSEPCEKMCKRATSLYGSCLSDWDVEWTSAGYENAAAHQESCEVWSWQNSEIHGAETIDGLCQDRASLFENGECDDYSSIDWNDLP